jgi:hypothetical protein
LSVAATRAGMVSIGRVTMCRSAVAVSNH